jgi:multidrug resistance efflux pump
MTKFNTFYFIVFAVGLALYFMTTVFDQQVNSFYGVAQNKETEVNKNFDLYVNHIYVLPGELVTKGQKLLDISRIREEEKLMDQDFEIDRLRAEERAWTQSQNSRIRDLENQKRIELGQLDAKIAELNTELEQRKSLFDGLSSVGVGEADFKHIEDRIEAIAKEKVLLSQSFDQRLKDANDGIATGKNPYSKQIAKLNAEKKYYDDTKIVKESILAPQDGRVGSIHCKLGEHIQAFNSLMSIYDLNPTYVLGYVQEDLVTQMSVDDEFIIKSANKNRILSYKGKLTGQESRFTPIDSRFSRDPSVTTWGQEINIQIPEDNGFLQNERVILEHIPKSIFNVSSDVEQASKLDK